MAYLITKSDGTTLTTVSDGQIDNLSTDLTLIGKNYSGFGESLNENFVKLLENFASTSRPTRPVRGQIWFDVTELKLKVYNGTSFQPVSSATISAIRPTTLTPGDLWFDDTNKQLYFYDGIDTLLLGPIYGLGQGLSGLRINTIQDTNKTQKVITSLYNNGTLIGIFSSATEEFTPDIPISGFSGTIGPGFNAADIAGIRFNVTVTNSTRLGGRPDTSYVRSDTSGIIDGKLGATNGVEIGSGFTGRLLVNNGELLLQNVSLNKPIKISANRGNIQDDAIVIEPATQDVKIYNGFISSTTTVGGNLTVKGNLLVEGNTVKVDVIDLRVENKNIELGLRSDSTSLTDIEADGGGIILRAASAKEFTWSNYKQAWVSSEHLDLAADKYFSIDGVPLLQKVGSTYALTSAVTLATGINIFGVQAEFTIDNLYINSNRISALNANGDIELYPNGSGNVLLNTTAKIRNVAEPSALSDAATKNYVDTQLRARSLAFSFDISDGISNSGIASWLEQVAPVAEYDNGTIARVLCSVISVLSTDIDLNADLNQSTSTFNTPTGTASAVIDVNFDTVTLPSPAVNVTRLVKTYQIISNAWTFVS